MSLSFGELVARLALGALLCAAIGVEREVRDQAAGLRTHVLVGLGATLFTLVSAYGFDPGSGPRADPTRIAAQVVSGIGFLGAGAIIRHRTDVRGLTTAASLWAAAAVGMAAGAGYYLGAAVTTALVLGTLVALRALRPALRARVGGDHVELELGLADEAAFTEVLRVLARGRVRVRSMDSALEGEREAVRMDLRVPPGLDFFGVLRELAALDGVRRAAASGMRAPKGAVEAREE